jgi:hypothetical protein
MGSLGRSMGKRSCRGTLSHAAAALLLFTFLFTGQYSAGPAALGCV